MAVVQRVVVPAESPVVAEVGWRMSMLARLEGIIYFVLSVVSALILCRFALVLVGANQGAGFTRFIMNLTGPMVSPFTGLIGTPSLELGDILAIIVYSIATAILVRLLRLLMAPATPVVAA